MSDVHSEDADLLSSDVEQHNEADVPYRENSVTVIVSDDSEEEDEKKETASKPKSFTDKDNKWLKLKEEGGSDNMEEEEMSGEEEQVAERESCECVERFREAGSRRGAKGRAD